MKKKNARTDRATSSSGKRGITSAILLDHMRGMEGRLVQRIDGVESKLTQRIDGVENSLTIRMDRLERKVDWITIGITNMDERLTDIEVVQIPKIKKSIGMRR